MEARMNQPAQREIMQQEIVLSDEERQPCEVWTRVMGYHRSVTSFNIGKKGEHYERQFFREARVG
jgi:anaerobic ribonucleoside-triphosphate reductase